MDEIVILEGARTPFGTYMGEMRHLSAAQLAIAAGGEAIARAKAPIAEFDAVFLGNVMQTDKESYYLSKYVGHKLGMRDEITGLVVNRLCGSGMQAVVSAAQAQLLGESELALAGGTECMSRAPFLLRGGRDGMRGNQTLEDPLLGTDSVFVDPACGVIMGGTAEILSDHYGISRAEMDAFALRSQEKAAAARASGRFAREIVPLVVPMKGKEHIIEHDEHIRETTLEKLGTLKPAFKPGGNVTPGNASGINDGAATLVVATRKKAEALGLKPKARIVSWGIAGVKGEHMGIGPAPAMRLALDRAKLSLSDMDLVEINEAFAGQYLSCEKELGLDRDRTNVHGGAIALGHPIGASGARILLTLMYELETTGGRYGIASACIGGGQGIAMVLERL